MSRASRLVAVVSILTLALATSAPAVRAAALPPGFVDEAVATVASPTAVAFTPDNRRLITSQSGTLWVKSGTTLKKALDLSAAACSDSERGLLGVAVDPSFATNHFIYLYYTFKKSGSCPYNSPSSPVNRVARFTLPDTNVIDVATQLVLIDNIPSPNGNHNGGDLHFARNGYLYVSVGDGGCDYLGNSGCGGGNDAARDRNVLLGKLLRITATGGIPPGNPYTGTKSARCNAGATMPGLKCQETFAWGFRNPFRFAIDPNGTGNVAYVNDVGQDTWEEVDQATAGADYGWNVREGHCALASTTDCGPPPAGMTNPIHDYAHTTGCEAITGGAFVPTGAWPASYDDSYLFGDYTCGRIFQLVSNGSGGFTSTLFATIPSGGPIAMAFGPRKAGQALYYTTYATNELRRIAYTGP